MQRFLYSLFNTQKSNTSVLSTVTDSNNSSSNLQVFFSHILLDACVAVSCTECDVDRIELDCCHVSDAAVDSPLQHH